ncbi:MAG: NADP-dependent isocitrate dehydrogenase [Blastochloris viridis]|uniref:Isocitrate dehydrogenase [NADP] n=1 Tax=Blastochloris viridis TaxID=1079 RepID=A0A6N4R315_BLAVI|nr:MAG: NADP-dependent isocitrate dehydrogenase [Blastochloris viridis]
MAKVPVTVARGDGIGPEIMDATLHILKAAGAELEYDFVNLGEKVFKSGIMNGIEPAAWESIRKNRLLFKAPITTPQGGGYKSVNVTMRKAFGQFANVRPVRTFDGFVHSKHANVDMVIVRENEESLYAGIEYRQTRDTCHAVKLISRTGTELIVRYAFEYARANGRKKVTCLIKDNIMKVTDGLFHQVFQLIGAEYPDIQKDSLIVDIGMARIADTPEKFDVVVTENLYGDIVSDIASQVAGSVGLAGSMNIGTGCAMFEAVHGSAPDIAGKGIANPSGLINAAVLMLYHVGQGECAAKIGNALLYTLEAGQHTADIVKKGEKALSTMEFAEAVVKNLGKSPKNLTPFASGSGKPVKLPRAEDTTQSVRTKRLTGVDVFVDFDDANAADLGARLNQCGMSGLVLQSVSSRGMEMFNPKKPDVKPDVDAVTDLWACRFMGPEGSVTNADIRNVLHNIEAAGLEWVKIENLYTFDHVAGFSGKGAE